MSAKDVAPYKGKRRKLLDVLVDPENGELDTRAVCAKAGVSSNTYYKYVKEPEFQNALKLCTVEYYARHIPQAATGLVKKAKKGDVRAVALMHDVLGMMSKPGATQTVNIAQAGDQVTVYESDADALVALEAQRAECDKYIEQVRSRMGTPAQGEKDDKG